MNKKILFKVFIILGLVGAILLVLTFIFTSVSIGKTVKAKCVTAKEKYEGDCVQALTKFVENEDNTFRQRNSAVWALGQLGDNRALPTLLKYYTGIIPKRDSLDQNISQYELKKAINLTSGSPNITAFIWRRNTL